MSRPPKTKKSCLTPSQLLLFIVIVVPWTIGMCELRHILPSVEEFWNEVSTKVESSSSGENDSDDSEIPPWIGIQSDEPLDLWNDKTKSKLKKKTKKHTIQDEVIVYLIQGPGEHAKEWVDILKERSESSILFYHSFDKDCPWCLFDESSKNWNMGRNLLLRHALKAIPQQEHVLFYAQFDYDAALQCSKHGQNHAKCILDMHNVLLDIGKRRDKDDDFVKTGMISPNTNFEPPSSYMIPEWHSCIDTTMWIIAPSYLHYLHPLATHLVDKGWNFGIQAMFDLMARYYSYGFYKLVDYTYQNRAHSSYPQSYDVQYMRNCTNQILENDWPELGPWHLTENVHHRCQVTTNMTKATLHGPNITFEEVSKRRFENWKALGYPSMLPPDLSRIDVSNMTN